MRVLIRGQAVDDLQQIWTFIATTSPRTATDVAMAILHAIERLTVLPEAGRKGRVRSTLERVVTRLPYIIVYRLDSDAEAIHVIGIVHGARER